MKKIFLLSLYCVFFYPLVLEAFEPDVIYGADNRHDLYDTSNHLWLKLADSTVSLFEAKNIELDLKTQWVKLKTKHFGHTNNLCRDEPFYTQPTGAYCSGSLVGPNLVLTAGHCFTDEIDCFDTRFVFGFDIKKKGVLPKTLPASEVYSCARLIVHYDSEKGADYALVELDRPVLNHSPLEINRDNNLKIKTPLVVMGHPSGLPTKIADGAKIRSIMNEYFFKANLDTYVGNSGSAVFNAETGLIEGVLVSGETDFITRNGCQISNRCLEEGCSGEQVTRSSIFARDIAELIQ
jgi:hypothetical protein